MSGPRIRLLPGERTSLFSPLGLRLVDDFTGGPPIGRVQARLEVWEASAWRAMDIAATTMAGGLLAYPGLGRRRDPRGLGPTLHRIIVETEFYRPKYPPRKGGFEFQVYPYNDMDPPTVIPAPTTGFLLPSVSYPFPSDVPVLRGRTLLRSGEPVADALVGDGNRRDAPSDERGEFVLPLRWAVADQTYQIDARHHPSGRVGRIAVQFPKDLSRGHIITLR